MHVLERFNTPEEAHLLRSRLEAAGIPAFVQDENFLQVHWIYSNSISGVRVEVAEENLERAQQFLLESKSDTRTDEDAAE